MSGEDVEDLYTREMKEKIDAKWRLERQLDRCNRLAIDAALDPAREEAFKQAVRDLILWLEEDFGFSRREAYLLMSMCPDCRLRTYQMCAGLGRLMTTVGAEFPKYLLKR